MGGRRYNTTFYSDPTLMSNGYQLEQFVKRHTRVTTVRVNFASSRSTKLMGVVELHNNAGNRSWTDYDNTRYFISCESLKLYWKDTSAYCNDDTNSATQNKCPPGIDVDYIDVPITVYKFIKSGANQKSRLFDKNWFYFITDTY